MKKNLLKKIIASSVAVFAVTAMAVPSMSVFAADTPTINVAPANKLTDSAEVVNIPLKKDIVLFNVDQSQILSPNVTYSYEITSASVTNATITTISSEDAANNVANPTPITLKVNAGPLEAVTTSAGDINTTPAKEGTITFGTDNTTKYATNDEGADPVDLTKKVNGTLTITIDASKIYDPDNDSTTQNNAPGVYRYKIADITADNALTAAGIDRKYSNSDTDKVIFLDVYTKYNTQRDGLEVYGYVFLKNTTNADNESVNYDNTKTTETLKITGFDTESENTNNYGDNTVASANLKSDSYHTYNVEVSKVTDGALADDKNNFPFKVELTNTNTVTSLDDFYYVITKDGTALTEVKTNLSNTGAWTLDGATASTNLQLQNGDKILITGLPVNTKIKVTETNNTADTYTVSAKGNNTDLTLKRNDNTTGTSLSVATNGTAELNALANVNKTTGKDEIVFTNTLKDISVTGLMFSIAPFVFITIAGVALLVLVMKNRKNSDNKSKI